MLAVRVAKWKLVYVPSLPPWASGPISCLGCTVTVGLLESKSISIEAFLQSYTGRDQKLFMPFGSLLASMRLQ